MKRKFGRKKDHRESMMANLVTSLVLYEKVKTTKPKAKETVSIIDKLITMAKDGTLASRRYLISFLKDKNAAKKIYESFVPRFKKRNSGYTKIYKLGHRVGDGAPMVIIRFVEESTPAVESEATKSSSTETNLKSTIDTNNIWLKK
ncbi:MAG: 50S ribosomal protein L17 [Patescibacteria group bacterium]|nr:50S ribosomal protein L17 [Patescibacteria group bacterium]